MKIFPFRSWVLLKKKNINFNKNSKLIIPKKKFCYAIVKRINKNIKNFNIKDLVIYKKSTEENLYINNYILVKSKNIIAKINV
ncbi:hypothetical protein [Candidatus Vidania fulgoroideorum]